MCGRSGVRSGGKRRGGRGSGGESRVKGRLNGLSGRRCVGFSLGRFIGCLFGDIRACAGRRFRGGFVRGCYYGG